MKYVLLRDDDINATTDVAVLERLYRPFAARGLPVCFAAIPEVRADIRLPDGSLEGFLSPPRAGEAAALPLGDHTALLAFLRSDPAFHVIQHGLRHEFVDGHFEFDRDAPADIGARLDRGLALLAEAGLPRPRAFVAPQDALTRSSLVEIARRYTVLSTGWYSLGRLPPSLWPAYLHAKKLRRRPHLHAGGNVYLTHPGCQISYRNDPATMLDTVLRTIDSQRLTVVVSHHWEYFRGGQENAAMIGVLHALAEALAGRTDLRVISFADLARDPGRYPL